MASVNFVKSTEEQLQEAKIIIQQWIDKQRHDRCWYYPDLFNQLVVLFDIKPSKEPFLPPLAEFQEGCKRYQEEEFQINIIYKP